MNGAQRAEVSAEIFAGLARIVHRTSQDAGAELARHHLNPAQFQLLRTLADHPGVTQAWLANHRGGTAAGVSQLLHKLEGAGLIRREPSGAANRLWLTDAGRDMVDRLVPQQDMFFVRRFGGLDDESLRTLQHLVLRALELLPDES